MKKLIAILLATLMLLSLTACGEGETNPQTEPDQPQPTDTQPAASDPATDTQPSEETQPLEVAGFGFTYEGVLLTPGQVFDASALPEANSLYTVPSCAIEGMDNVYCYDGFEVTAFNDGTQEIIYSIWLSDPNLTTDEGLTFGDDIAKLTELYGGERTENGTALVYTRGDTQLSLILQDGTVIDIQYLWIAE